MTASATPLASALRFWEPRRLLYNAILAAFALAWLACTWPHFRPMLSGPSLLALTFLALLANLCYCAAYFADAIFQSVLPAALNPSRWTLFAVGAAFAVLLENYWIADEIYPYAAVPNPAPEMNVMSHAFASNINFPAPVAVLAFLAAGAGLFFAAATALVAWFVKRPDVARMVARIAAAGAVLYTALLLAFSLASRQAALPPAAEKYFCEIDCHLAYSVLDSETKSAQPPADGPHYLVTLRTRFDETTTSPNRPKDAPLTPSPRRVLLYDQSGHAYSPVSTSGTPLLTALKPADSFTTTLEFALPPGSHPTRLLVTTQPAWPDHFVIGDENSLLHAKTYFAL